jgi:hypothetical protein
MTWECKPDAELAHLPPASGSCGKVGRLCRALVPQALVVEAALESIYRQTRPIALRRLWRARLDRMTRQIERLERHVTISNEALAVFVRFWLTSTPPLPDTALAAAQIKGRERYEGFVEALGRRLARGRKLADEITRDAELTTPKNDAESRSSPV